MNLKEFISETLEQIISGVSDAQTNLPGDGEVNPHIWMAQRGDAAKHKILESNSGKWIHLVKFDVAVTVAEGSDTKGGIGLFVGPVTLGSSGGSKLENSSVNRIQFEIPVAYPKTDSEAEGG